MTQQDVQTIGYDVRDVWKRDRRWNLRRLTRADLPGLCRTRKMRPVRTLVKCGSLSELDDPSRRSWILDVHDRASGAIGTRVSRRRTPASPHPWSTIDGDDLVDDAPPSLVVDCMFWERDAFVEEAELIRRGVCGAIQREAFAEARADLSFDPGALEPAGWLMMVHAAFDQDRWYREPISVFLRAGFYLQGWFEDADRGCVARLNWPNRAR